MRFLCSRKTIKVLRNTFDKILEETLFETGLRARVTDKHGEFICSAELYEIDNNDIALATDDEITYAVELDQYTIINEDGTRKQQSSLSTSCRREIRSTAFDGENGCNQQ